MNVLHRSLIDNSYNDAVQCLLHDLGCNEEEITAEDYEAVEACCDDMGWTGSLRNRIMDLVPCEESEEEIEQWKTNTHGAEQRSDGTWTDEEES